MIKLTTTRFGELEVEEDKVIELDDGLVGFPAYRRWVLLQFDPESPFSWLQSLDEESVALVVVDPRLFCPGYVAEIELDEATKLGIGEDSESATMAILNMATSPQAMTANLKAPLVVNLATKKGKQVIQGGSEWHTRHNVMEMMRAQMSEPGRTLAGRLDESGLRK